MSDFVKNFKPCSSNTFAVFLEDLGSRAVFAKDKVSSGSRVDDLLEFISETIKVSRDKLFAYSDKKGKHVVDPAYYVIPVSNDAPRLYYEGM